MPHSHCGNGAPNWVTRAGRRSSDTAAALLFLGAVSFSVAGGLAVVYVLGRSGIYSRRPKVASSHQASVDEGYQGHNLGGAIEH